LVDQRPGLFFGQRCVEGAEDVVERQAVVLVGAELQAVVDLANRWHLVGLFDFLALVLVLILRLVIYWLRIRRFILHRHLIFFYFNFLLGCLI
jgi:hypothetical protein